MNSKYIALLLVCSLLLTACGSSPPSEPTPDVAAVRTSAASTVISQFTLTAAVFTPIVPSPIPAETDTPGPTATATQPPVAQVTNAEGTTIALCDKYAWDVATVDVNVPDNTVMSPGEDFTKTWLIKNIGSCAWGEGYKLIYSYGERMSGEAQPLTAAIAPGQEVEVSVNFKAPDLAGTYFSFWTLQNALGVNFLGNDNKALYVQIVVQ
jgi:Ig-like domain-containing protein